MALTKLNLQLFLFLYVEESETMKEFRLTTFKSKRTRMSERHKAEVSGELRKLFTAYTIFFFTAMTMRNVAWWEGARGAFVRTDITEERIASGVSLWLLIAVNVVPSSPILVTLMMETICSFETSSYKKHTA
jgi:hypothetical protein